MCATCGRRSTPSMASHRPGRKSWIVLPGSSSGPCPSLELQADIEDEIATPNSWNPWRVDTLQAVAPMDLLRILATKPPKGTGSARIAPDLEFWQHLVRRLARAVRQHEYLPAIFVHKGGKRVAGKRARKPATSFEAGWELGQGAEDRIVATCSRAIPGACRAMWARPPRAKRHCTTRRESYGTFSR